MSFKVTVDQNLCGDHGQCVFAAPEVYQFDAAGRLEVLIDEPGERLRARYTDAADVCQVQAITINN